MAVAAVATTRQTQQMLPRVLSTSHTPTPRRLMALTVFVVVAALSLAKGSAAQPKPDRNSFVPAQSPNRHAAGDGRGPHVLGRLNPTIQVRPRVVTEDSAVVTSAPDPVVPVASTESTMRTPKPHAPAPIVRPSNNSLSRGGSGNRGDSRGRGDIVFPDNEHASDRRRLLTPLTGPPPCAQNGLTFCEDVDDYPADILAETLENTVAYTDFFGNDSMPQPIGDRLGGETTLCPSTEKLIFPKVAQNKEDQWMYIVNLDERYQQGIRVEKCMQENQKCLMSEIFPDNVGATCRQKYVYRKLLAVDGSGEPQPDSFRLPSCCACFVDSAVLSRAAFGLNNSSSPRQRRAKRRSGRGF